MSTIQVTYHYTVGLTSDEFRLIGLALTGRLARADDIASAVELNQRLTEQRARFIREHADVVAGAATRAAEDTTSSVQERLERRPHG